MSTSANVILYRIEKDGKPIHVHHENLMCNQHYEDLLKFQPLAGHTITPYGYDEEEEYWEGNTEILETYLRKLKHKPVKEYFQNLKK